MHIIECVKCVTLHKILHVRKIYMFVYTHSTCVSCVFYILSTYYTGEICHFGWSGFVTYACLFVHLSRPHTEIFQHFYDCSLLQQFPLLIAWLRNHRYHTAYYKKKTKNEKVALKIGGSFSDKRNPFRIGWLGSLKGLWTRPPEGLIDVFFRWRQFPSQTCSILLRSWSCLFWGGIPLRESQEYKSWRKLFPKKHAWWKITNSMPSIK